MMMAMAVMMFVLVQVLVLCQRGFWLVKPFPRWIEYSLFRIWYQLPWSGSWQDILVISCKAPYTLIDLLVTDISLTLLS